MLILQTEGVLIIDPKKINTKAPKLLELTVTDPEDKLWGKVIAQKKVFSSGSVSFYWNGKVENPESHERYQAGLNITLIGCKPD